MSDVAVVGSFVVAGKGALIDEYVDLLAGTPGPNLIDTEAETSAPTQVLRIIAGFSTDVLQYIRACRLYD